MTDIAALHPRYAMLARRCAAAVAVPPTVPTHQTVMAAHTTALLMLGPYIAADGLSPAAGQRDAEALTTDVLETLTNAVEQLVVATHHVRHCVVVNAVDCVYMVGGYVKPCKSCETLQIVMCCGICCTTCRFHCNRVYISCTHPFIPNAPSP